MAEELVIVERYRFLPEAEAARMYLESEGITAFLADAETVNMDWFLANAIGNIKLQVPSAQAETARALLDRLRENQQQRREHGEENEEEGSAVCLACGGPMSEEASACPACGWSYTDVETP
jgi:hypothetical protein